MRKLDLEKLLLNVFQEDKIENKEHTIFSQMAMITIKSLIPNENLLRNTIDYNRFKEELKLLKLYKRENKKYKLIDIDEDLYFSHKDETIYARIFPIIIANKDYGVIEEEVIKNILYTTGDLETLLQGVFISKLVFMMIEGEANLLGELKEYIINFSQVELLNKYSDSYLYDYLDPKINFEVNFERLKVSLVTLFHGIPITNFEYLKDLLEMINGDKLRTLIGFIIEKSRDQGEISYQLNKSYERMASYIIRLRENRIDPKDLKIKEYILPNIFSFKEGETFFHSLLNNSKVIKKEVKEGSLTSLVQTRAGMYLFKRDPIS